MTGAAEADQRRSGSRTLPNFLIIGAMKAGTTSLSEYLRAHPQIFMSKTKELDFFLTDGPEGNWGRGLGWYERQFEGAGTALAVGEASPAYTMYPHAPGVPERIAKVLPDVRLIYLVRDPFERMRSQYLMRIWNGREDLPIARALLERAFYVDLSKYAMQVDRYLDHFAGDRLLVITSERLKTDRPGVLARIADFLGVEPDINLAESANEYNRGETLRQRRTLDRAFRRIPGYGWAAEVVPEPLRLLKYRLTTRRVKADLHISDAVRVELEGRLRDDVARLRSHLGEDFDGWGIA